MEESQSSLVLKAREGDTEAYGKLVELHWERLVRLSRSMVGESTAEDAVQDSLIAAWKKLDKLNNPESFKAWLTRIVYRRCLWWSRRRRFDDAVDDLPESAQAGDAESGIWVEQALSRLAPRQRAVLHLTVVEDLTDSEIGGLLGIAAGSVRAHRRRAREKLESLVEGGKR
ncbi:RNA polymerase sigma factor [Acidobacteriota bacterium]